jgi:hypothetical protein
MGTAPCAGVFIRAPSCRSLRGLKTPINSISWNPSTVVDRQRRGFTRLGQAQRRPRKGVLLFERAEGPNYEKGQNGSINRAFNPLLKNNRFAWGDVVDYNGSPVDAFPRIPFSFSPFSETPHRLYCRLGVEEDRNPSFVIPAFAGMTKKRACLGLNAQNSSE